MARTREKRGYGASRYNRLQHGVMVQGLLPSRGPEACPLSGTCPVAADPAIRESCVPGDECPFERHLHKMYVDSALSAFSFCLAWLPPEEFERLTNEAGFLELRRMRLSALTAKEGFTRPKIHPVSGVEYGLREALGSVRYSTAVDNAMNSVLGRLLRNPAA